MATFAWQQLRGQHLARLGNMLRGNICVATFAWQHLRGTFAWQHLRSNLRGNICVATRRRHDDGVKTFFPKNHSSNSHSDSHPDPQKKIEVFHFQIQNVEEVTVSEHVGGQKNHSLLSIVPLPRSLRSPVHNRRADSQPAGNIRVTFGKRGSGVTLGARGSGIMLWKE